MRRFGWFAMLALAVGACASPTPDRVREYNEDGVHLYHKGSFAEARESFQAALAPSPADPEILFNLGQCHDKLGNFDLAEKGYEACLKQGPDHSECRHALVVLLVGRGRRPDAERMIEEWAKQSSKPSGPYAEEGWLFAQDGDVPAAMGLYQHALDIDPGNTRALTELARLYEARGRPERAAVLYGRVLEINPNHPEVARRLAEIRAKGVGQPHPD